MLLITQIKEERQSNPPHLYAHFEPKPKSVTADISGLCFLLPQTRGATLNLSQLHPYPIYWALKSSLNS